MRKASPLLMALPSMRGTPPEEPSIQVPLSVRLGSDERRLTCVTPDANVILSNTPLPQAVTGDVAKLQPPSCVCSALVIDTGFSVPLATRIASRNVRTLS